MTINFSKMQLVSFTCAHNPTTSTYTICNQPITKSPPYKYLCVDLSSDLAWNTHLTRILSNANRFLGYLRRNLKFSKTTSLHYTCEVPTRIHVIHLASLARFIGNKHRGSSKSRYQIPIFRLLTDTTITSLRINFNLNLFSSRRTLSRLSFFQKIYYHNGDMRTSLLFPSNCFLALIMRVFAVNNSEVE